MLRQTCFIASAALGACCAIAAAQTAPPGAPPLQRLDPAVGDVDPLSVSLREMQVDLRQPTDFQHIYQVPGERDLYMRIDGGLYAVFPQSVYRQTQVGLRPLIPAGTVFFVGPPAWLRPSMAGSSEPRPNAALVRARIETRIAEEPEKPSSSADLLPITSADDAESSEHSMSPRIVSDAPYRSQRIAQLLEHAARATQSTQE